MLVLAAVLSLVSVTSSVTLKEELVYPRLLQERSANGELLLRVNDDMTLRLRKSSVLASDLFFTTNADGKSEHTLWNGTRLEENLYHDSQHQSSVMLSQEDHALKVEGILSPNLRIKPLLTEERTVGAPIVHKLYEIEEPKMDLRESAHDPFDVSFSFPWLFKTWQQPPQPPAVAKELPEEYVSELHVVSCSSHEKQFATNEELIAYLAVLMNAVNIWYEGMEEPRLKLKVVGITRNSDGESEVKEEGYLMADRTLNQFSDYADKKIPGSPDAIYMITNQDMADVTHSGTIASGIAGLAFVGTLCIYRNVGIGEDPARSYKGIYAAAHEIAHILGAAHDGDPGAPDIPNNPGAKACSWKEGYLMSYEDGGHKKYQLSPCSQGQIRALLRHVPQKCLDETSQRDYMTRHKKLPGQMITEEEYCKILFKAQGTGMPVKDPKSLKDCKMQCCLRTYYGPGKCEQERLLEGMACGDGKTCRKGICGNHTLPE
ncbi:venom metalloproteinase BumaMPs1-like [Amblyomma americanum]